MSPVQADSAASRNAAGLAFDTMAANYDEVFTFSHVGRAQRDVVWQRALRVFAPGSHLLELNCGTGEDALFLAAAGMQVTACDASAGMIAYAEERMAKEAPHAAVHFYPLATECLDQLSRSSVFDGAFSNFSGLNCVRDLSQAARELALRLRPGAAVLVCLSTRLCLWESLFYFSRLQFRKGARRWAGESQATVGAVSFPVFYPTLSAVRHSFSPVFKMRAVTGVGITVPPSYLEAWISRYPGLLRAFCKVDSLLSDWPFFRCIGDHMLLELERVEGGA